MRKNNIYTIQVLAISVLCLFLLKCNDTSSTKLLPIFGDYLAKDARLTFLDVEERDSDITSDSLEVTSFDPNVDYSTDSVTYQTTVPGSTDNVTFYAFPVSYAATVTIDSNPLSNGIIVLGHSGITQTYTIVVRSQDGSTEATYMLQIDE